jgi:outer membrane murein-binding lipoprotein Lpp
VASIMCPTPVRQLWLYRPTGPDTSTSRGGWEVGFFDATGDWCPESVHVEPGPAADRVHWLNGGDTVADADGQLDQADDEITRLQAKIARLTRDRDKLRNQALRAGRHRRVRARRTPRGQR